MKLRTELKVKLAKKEMAEEIYKVFLKCSDETNFLATDSKERVKGGFTIESVLNQIEMSNKKDSLNRYFVLMYKGKIIGLMALFSVGNRKRIKHRLTFGINILKEYWNLGGGSLLIEEAIKCFNSNELLKKLELTVHEENTKAVGLYKKFGFEIEGRLKKHFYIDNQYKNALVMGIEK